MCITYYIKTFYQIKASAKAKKENPAAILKNCGILMCLLGKCKPFHSLLACIFI